MTIQKTEIQKAIESYEAKKAKLQTEIAGVGECKTGLEAVTAKTEYINMQITAYTQEIADKTALVAEIDEVITKLKAE
jgi:prefoldin subunit 5